MKKYNIGILGATGAVGVQMLECLEERNIPVNELRLLASARSVGKKLKFKDQEIEVIEAKEDAFEGLDFVLGAAQNPIALKFADAIVKAGAVFIDNSSAFRMKDEVPLVVPEINGDDALKNNGIIANPNCSTIITLMAVSPINKLSKILSMHATTFQAVSGAGVGGMAELEDQMQALTNNGEIKTSTFPYQIAYNVIPQIGDFLENGYTKEEMKMQNEGRKIMHLPELVVDCTCVRIPVMRSHSISVSVVTENPLDVKAIQDEVLKTKGLRLKDDPANKVYPMPLNTTDQDLVEVGRIRKDLVSPNGITLFCSGDQIRKGAATNAVQIMEYLIENNQ